MSSTSNNILFVRHLPEKFSNEEKMDLLKHFGATDARLVIRKGKKEVSAFAIFPNEGCAKFAMGNLHQLNVAGSRLVVEYATEKHDFHNDPIPKPKKILDSSNESKNVGNSVTREMQDFHKKLQYIAPQFNINYPLSPSVKYLYPPPNNITISNIAHTLMSVPRFYNQVLHLMNKMNLPPPFGNLTPVPPVPIVVEAPPFVLDKNIRPKPSTEWAGEEEMMTSETESELESDAENASKRDKNIELPKKRPATKRKVPRPVKQGKLLHFSHNDTNKAVTAASDVFEAPESAKKVGLKITPVGLSTESIPQSEHIISSGFGTFAPTMAAEEEEEGRQSPESTDYIRSSELKSNRISKNDMKNLPQFKNYCPGEPTTRLYIKNIARAVGEEDIKYIYRRYVNMKVEDERNMFDVRLMTKGRMNGQAFVTLPKQSMAELAVQETNGYILKDKPLIVQFARSAKAKESKLLP